MVWWLLREPPIIESHSLACIVDDVGHYYIDKDYRELGESEGWLIRTGFFRDEYGTLVWTYVMHPP